MIIGRNVRLQVSDGLDAASWADVAEVTSMRMPTMTQTASGGLTSLFSKEEWAELRQRRLEHAIETDGPTAVGDLAQSTALRRVWGLQ